MSFSKSILVMLAVAIVFVALNRFVVGAIAKELALVGLIFGTLLAAFGLINLPTETLQIRTLLWQEPFKWLSQSPIIGNGLTAARSANLEQGWYLQIHSTVVQTLIELGIVGLLLLYLAVRRSLMNGNALIVFITGAFLGTMVTYETMSHTFAVLILGILPLAIKQTQVKNAESASIYVINGIAHGGAERVVQNMANNAHENEKVIIYLLAEKPSDAYSLSQNVEIRGIGKGGSKLLLPFYLWRLNRWLENDWAHHRITLATAHLPFAQLVARLSRFNSEFIYVNHGMFGVSNQGFSSLMTKFIYNQRLNVAVSQQMLEEEVRQNFGVVSRHDDFIYNPIDMQAIAELAGPVVERSAGIPNKRILVQVSQRLMQVGLPTKATFTNFLVRENCAQNCNRTSMHVGLTTRLSWSGLSITLSRIFVRPPRSFILQTMSLLEWLSQRPTFVDAQLWLLMFHLQHEK